jgi:pimeloyl-ACP methyl ester carboxylesterase
MTIKSLLKRTLRLTGQSLALLFIAINVLLLFFAWQAGQRETAAATQLAPASGRFVQSMGSRIFIQEMGPADGQAVLLVHGTGAWSEAWKPTMEVLASAGFHPIAIDLPPFGFSQRPQSADYSKITQGKRITGVLDSLNIRNVILVGHSFGAGPTMEAALQLPGKVRGIILVDAALSVNAATEQTQTHAVGALSAVMNVASVRDALVATFLTNPLFTHRLLTLFIYNPEHATDEWVTRYRRPLALEGTTKAVSHWLPELLIPRAVATSERPSTYHALNLPLHLIWGDRDTITPLEQARYIKAITPNSLLRVIPDVGHIPQIEAPDLFNQLLVNELSTLTATP